MSPETEAMLIEAGTVMAAIHGAAALALALGWGAVVAWRWACRVMGAAADVWRGAP